MNTKSTQSNRKKRTISLLFFAVKLSRTSSWKNGPFFLHQINPANASELTSSPSRIYFSHDLTPFYQKLLYEAPKKLSKVQLPTNSDVLRHHLYLKYLVLKDKKKTPAAAKLKIKVAETVENQNSNVSCLNKYSIARKIKKYI
jgi:hypothetical protein